MAFIIPLALALVLSFVYILSSRFSRHAERYHEHILSLGSGMLLAIIFAEVLDEQACPGNREPEKGEGIGHHAGRYEDPGDPTERVCCA